MMNQKLKRLGWNSFFVLLLVTGCRNIKEDGAKKKLTTSLFHITLDTSKGFVRIKENNEGEDGLIIVGDKDSIYYNLGYDVSNLAEKDPPVFYYPYPTDTITLDTSLVDPREIRFATKLNFDIDEFRKQNVYFEVIDGYRAKITLPRMISNGGIVGVYFDSLRSTSGGRLKFNLYSKSSDSVTNSKLLESIRTIHFTLR